MIEKKMRLFNVMISDACSRNIGLANAEINRKSKREIYKVGTTISLRDTSIHVYVEYK